jgi:hypothetical protein
MSIKEIINQLGGAKLVAVSKTKPVEAIQYLYDQGQRIFGENKVQELCSKAEQLPQDIEWHLIGHLQSNKVKYIAPFIAMIHSVDKLSLLEEIQKQAQNHDRKIQVLLQFHIAQEETKFGLSIHEALELLEYVTQQKERFGHVEICGVMGMASFIDDEEIIRKEFQTLKNYFQLIKDTYFPIDLHFKEVSMGMSGDYQVAVQEGSTMVRIGSLLFGNR